jgi:hypothetical protein
MADVEIPVGGLESLDELKNAQYIRAEFVNPVFKPKITLNYGDLTFNTACVKVMGDTEYVQLLVLEEARRLVAMPCGEFDKDSVKWSIIKDEKPRSRNIRAKIACAKLFQMMNWNINYRYKIMAVYQVLEGQRLIVFNLAECEMLVPEEIPKEDGTIKTKRNKVYPIDWEKSFGSPYSEHRETYAVDLNKLYLLSNNLEADEVKPPVDPRVPTASEIITRQYYVPDEIKKGGDGK